MAVYVYTINNVEPVIRMTLDAAFRECPHLLHFRDNGVDGRVAKTWVATYTVSQAGVSPQLRGLFEEPVDIII